MPRNYFTDEQIEELNKSGYVSKISKASVIFTEDFKIKYLNLLNSGITPSNILRELGINPKTLGQARIYRLTRNIKEFSKRPEGFARKKNSSTGRPRKKKTPNFENDKQALEYYKEYSLKLEQELEFVKKIQALEEKQNSSRAKNSK